MAGITTTLTGELAEFVERSVASGDYASADEMVATALDRLRLVGESRLEELRAALAIGEEQIAHGDYAEIDIDQLVTEVKLRGGEAA